METLLYLTIIILCAMFAYVLVYFTVSCFIISSPIEENEVKTIHIKNNASINEKQEEIDRLFKVNEYFIKKYNDVDSRREQIQKALNKLSNETHADIISRDRKIDELNKTIDQLTNKLIESHNDRYSKGLIC
jgi:cell division protein YceG involved in septum cleavage